MDQSSENSKISSFFKFDKIALIIGFIADSIAIAAILFSLQTVDIKKNLPNFINPGFAFSLWVITLYIYLAYLHYYWEKNKEIQELSNTFFTFLLDNLLGFFKPILLFPGLILLIFIFWIVFFVDGPSFSTFGPVLFVAIGIVFIIKIIRIFAMVDFDDEKIDKDFRELVIARWKFLSKYINSLLENQQWVDTDDLSPISLDWGYSDYQMQYILSQYALKHPETTKYGVLIVRKTKKEDPYLLKGGEKVLINLESLDRSKYSYT